MKPIYQLILLAAISMFALENNAVAASKSAAQPKIAVVNIQQAVVSTDKAKQLITKLEAEPDYADAKKQVNELQSSLEKLVAEAKKEGATWSADQREAATKQAQSKKDDLEHLVRKVQGQNKQLVEHMMNVMAPDIQVALHDIVDKEGITLLLERQFVLHVDAAFDVTPQLTAKLNSTK